MQEYSPQKIESKWQKLWEQGKIFEVKDNSKKPKFYVLDMFPYPSGAGLHVGHPRGYIGTDVISHYMRMRGYNVMHPMGWDAFGLPAENYAIKTGIHPSITTKENIARFKEQMKKIGLSYDWSREINTTDPEYYKWTQWIFLKLFEMGLAYQAELPINWCPSCKTGLANEEVVNGKCERCGAVATKKNIKQWVLKITDYAEKLLKGLENLDWPEQIKEMQRNWIGRSIGAEICFQLTTYNLQPTTENLQMIIFTTRLDTIFGATFMVLAPENNLVAKITTREQLQEVKEYQKITAEKTDIERQAGTKEKTGVFTGAYAINPANGKEIPIYIADYVLPYYGYGAIMAVPAHDERDYEFAKKYNLPIIEAIKEVQSEKNIPRQAEKAIAEPNAKIHNHGHSHSHSHNFVYDGEGALVNSAGFDGMDSIKAKEEIVKWLGEKGLAKEAINYKLRDWVFSRQRYWGEPIPLIFCENCKKLVEMVNSQQSKVNSQFSKGELLNPGWVAVPEKDLPLKLPEIEKYEPIGTGESPLALEKKWTETICPKCGGKATRETNTMPQWAGSCWYFIAYVMRENQKPTTAHFQWAGLPSPYSRAVAKFKENKFSWDKEKIKYWLPVDFYVGGAEHAVLHLLYSRFWIKVLYDAGIIHFDEPFLKLRTIGLILSPDGQKMSKSRGNVISPDDIIRKYGADVFRVYEMFMGPFDQAISWDPQGILGAQRFLQKIWRLFKKLKAPSEKRKTTAQNSKLNKLLHKTIKKVTEDIELQKFNTVIAAMMELVNEMEKQPELSVASCRLLVKLLAPFAPHMAEELWQKLNISVNQRPPASALSASDWRAGSNQRKSASIFEEEWPKYESKLIEEEKITFIVQINGKVRGQIEADAGISEKEAKEAALKSLKIQKWLQEKTIKKTIFVPNKIVNFVVE